MTRYEPPKISYHVTQRVLQKIVKKKKTNLKNCSTFFYSFSVGRGGSRISQTEVPTAERGCINLLLGKMFAKNCMKMKEIGHWGQGGRSLGRFIRQLLVLMSASGGSLISRKARRYKLYCFSHSGYFCFLPKHNSPRSVIINIVILIC